jgi:hypothetical protein
MQDGKWRSDPTGDLGRISRQQVFIRRAISRAVEKGPRNPITLKKLVDVGSKNVRVDDDLPVRSLLALGRRFAEFDAAGLEALTLPVDPDRTDGGADILRLREDEAEPVLAQFRDEPPPDDEPAPEQLTPSASVTVLNGSGVNGQAAQASAWLQQVGFTVSATGNASEIGLDAPETTLIRHGPEGEAQAGLLADLVVGTDPDVEPDPTLEGDALVLVTGPDFDGIRGDDGKKLDESAVPSKVTAEATTTSPSTSVATGEGDGAPATTPTTVIGRTPGQPPPGESCG